MEVLVNGTSKEISSIFDNTGRDVTEDFLKETINKVKSFYNAYYAEKSPYFSDNEISYFRRGDESMALLPPYELDNDITYNLENDRFNMSERSFKWWEEYAPKHNEVSALEKQALPYMQNIVDNQIKYLCSLPECDEEQLVSHYSISENNPLFAYSKCLSKRLERDAAPLVNLNYAANVKSEFLRAYAQEHEIDITGIDKISDLPNRLTGLTTEERTKDFLIPKEPTTVQAQNEKTLQTDNAASPESIQKEILINLEDENMQLKSENTQLKNTVKKLKSTIDKINAIFRENPPLIEAFRQAKAEFMQKRNSQKQEHPIDKSKQENKPKKHNKR